eukprot:TRINITY_DN7264_c0_g1_i1.p1 TRINITY_DN7264_c0_g1~~TRINITY_DN7264_c0_g1_i1.p1  ORF type:complete len:1124 (-),score=299.58 TRINITY_DN7264_c0_g1_i1:209-3406(-)
MAGDPSPDDFGEEEDYDGMEETLSPEAVAELTGTVESMANATFPEKFVNLWKRPPLYKDVNPKEDDIVFQQISIDYYVGHVPQYGESAIVRVLGLNERGNSVCGHIFGFEPYFYAEVPQKFNPDDCEVFMTALNKALDEKNERKGRKHDMVLRVEPMQKQTIMKYHGGKSKLFLKITTQLPRYVPTCRSILEGSYFSVPGYGSFRCPTYEADILYVLRFMIDCDIVGGNWVGIPKGKYEIVDPKRSVCQIEVKCDVKDLISHPPEGLYMSTGPLRVLSFDIECGGRPHTFPEPDKDPVIQIAAMMSVHGDEKGASIKAVFTLGSCSNIVGAQVFSFEKEEDLLMAWNAFFQIVDPDIVTGYNIMNFDIPYIFGRAEALSLDKFGFFTRINGLRSKLKDSRFSSRAYGIRESKEVNMEGRVILDMLQIMQREHKLSSYSLNAVSAHFLNEQKEDVHYSIITELQNGDSETRRRLAVYCLKDAYLPLRLMERLLIIVNYIEMARVTGVPIPFLTSRGQQIKVVSQLLRRMKHKGLLMPSSKKTDSTEGTFTGATVIEPTRGFHNKPIATLDFASLYPSIMMAHNLCYTTLLSREEMVKLPSDAYSVSPLGHAFVKEHVQKGILPEILFDLLAARKKAKGELKSETDPMKRKVLDGRQLALKISANSVYGFTGAQVGKLPCLEISSSVTSYGREMIEETKRTVEKKYTIANGYPKNANVIYGDTDSVMVDFGVTTVEEGMRLGLEAANYVTDRFIKPIRLEFEKVYFPYLLISKKRYAGLLWTNPEKHDRMDCKGIETVRRDNCLLVKTVITTVLNKILIERSVQDAVDYVKSTISDLLRNRIDISMLVITKALSKSGADYAAKQAHVELAERMRKRDPGSAPHIGDRVPYIMIEAAKGARGYEKAEDPIYVLEKGIPIDNTFYLEHQLQLPLERIFAPILGDATRSLFSGEHTRVRSKPTPTNIGIMKFAQLGLKCLSCRTPLPKGRKTVCSHCEEKESEMYIRTLSDVRRKEDAFGRLWTQCQRCQQSLHQDVLCSNKDCPIFYMRKKTQKDLEDSYSTLGRFIDF